MVLQEATGEQERDADCGAEASVPLANRRGKGYRAMAPVIALSILAWAALWLWSRSPYSRFLSHHSLDAVRGDISLALVFIAGWVVMVIAMMLPSTLPLLAAFQRLNRQRADANQLGILLIAGYLLTWTLFGVAIYAGDWLLHQLIHTSQWLAGWLWVLPGLTLIVAGAYQFTPLKRTCLDACRSPLHCFRGRWDGNTQAHRSLLVGLHHGLCCVGCCWALMLLMFASGASNMGWMVALSIVMLAEKRLPWGQRLVVPIGVALLLWGSVLLLGTPPDASHLHHH
jgi:predicted metal-binding membrane protein